jgi:hypothetical protein
MADNVTNELLLEHLKAIQGKLARHDEAFQRIEGDHTPLAAGRLLPGHEGHGDECGEHCGREEPAEGRDALVRVHQQQSRETRRVAPQGQRIVMPAFGRMSFAHAASFRTSERSGNVSCLSKRRSTSGSRVTTRSVHGRSGDAI